jgi:hypothetical protein
MAGEVVPVPPRGNNVLKNLRKRGDFLKQIVIYCPIARHYTRAMIVRNKISIKDHGYLSTAPIRRPERTLYNMNRVRREQVVGSFGVSWKALFACH